MTNRQRSRNYLVLLLYVVLLLLPIPFIRSYFPRQLILTCTRAEQTLNAVACDLQQKLLMVGTVVDEVALRQVSGAEVIQQARISEEGAQTAYRVKIYADQQEFDLGSDYFALEKAKTIADQINGFIADPNQPTLQIQQSGSQEGWIFLGFFFFPYYGLLGVLVIRWVRRSFQPTPQRSNV
jgi:hypothetical protein